MPIIVTANLNYGGNLVNQKYQPIELPALRPEDQHECLEFCNDRINILAEYHRFPSTLNFFTEGQWDNIRKVEDNADSKPPILVFSSNRANWIADGFNRGRAILQDLGLEHFDDVNDLNALNSLEGDLRPVPGWYYPRRVNENNRRTYIVVHGFEFQKYRKLLSSIDNMHVIGWSFPMSPEEFLAGTYPYVGFGASRYAALEFCKVLRRTAHAPWDYAWLVDDNVYYLNAFRGLASAEAAIQARNYVGLGFGSETATDTTNAIWQDRAGNARFVADAAGDYNAGDFRQDRILQQAVLWNIDWLDRNHLNYSPYFIASAEDTSITNYFRRNRHAFGVTTASTILKETVTYHDDDVYSKRVNLARNYYQRWYASTESAKEIINSAVDQPSRLGDFICDHVLSNPYFAEQRRDLATRHRAVCQASEVIMANAILQNGFTTDQLFKPNGDQPQNTRVT
jgi:hypothetical protein